MRQLRTKNDSEQEELRTLKETTAKGRSEYLNLQQSISMNMTELAKLTEENTNKRQLAETMRKERDDAREELAKLKEQYSALALRYTNDEELGRQKYKGWNLLNKTVKVHTHAWLIK